LWEKEKMIEQIKSVLVLTLVTAFIATGLFSPMLITAGDLEPPGDRVPTTHSPENVNTLGENTENNVCYPTGVEKTGQTISYATGDDGDLQKGMSWPNPRFTDNGDGTVTDILTGLIWLKDANKFGKRSWTDALSDCNTLADDGVDLTDGSSARDWRLPNVKELSSLIGFGNRRPALPSGHPFTNVQRDYYWSSTTHADHSHRAWYVRIPSGRVNNDRKTDKRSVWPVRGGN
jgi:hypothetical protein